MNITIVNCDTGEIVEREMTEEELLQRELDIAEYTAAQEAREQEEANKLAAKQSAITKLSALGLDENEINAILGGI